MGENSRDDVERASRGSEATGEPRPFGYYYDDGTGYEVYRPEEDEDEEEGDAAEKNGDEKEDESGEKDPKPHWKGRRSPEGVAEK